MTKETTPVETKGARIKLREHMKHIKSTVVAEGVYGNFAEYKEVENGHNNQAIPREEKERVWKKSFGSFSFYQM